MDWVIRATTEAEWRSLRDTRIEALTDTPNVFGTRLADAIEYSEDYWRERANGEGSFRFFLAWVGPKPIGIAGLILEDESQAQVIQLWVSPDYRGKKLGRALIARTVEEAVAAGRTQLHLWVTVDNGAIDLYERMGFVPTGRYHPLPSNPLIEQLEMESATSAVG